MTLLKLESVRPVQTQSLDVVILSQACACDAIHIDLESALVTLTGKKSVQLHQELEVDIVTLGRLAMGVADVMAIKIDTWAKFPTLARVLIALGGRAFLGR